jgi:opacity protein-like surface antigen
MTRSKSSIPTLPGFCATALTATLATAMPTAAEEARGPYVRALSGVGWAADTSLGGSTIDADGKYDVGFLAGAATGYDFGRWRLEGELVYRTNGTDRLSGARLPPGADGGDLSSLGVGVNALLEFDLLGSPAITSHVGAGLVYLQEIDIDLDSPTGELSYSDADWAFQLLAGARYRISDAWSINAEVRYLTASDLTLKGEGAAAGSIDLDYDHTSVILGLEYRF